MKTNECVSWILGCVSRKVSSPFPHLLKDDDVVSCCLDLSIPCISFRVNGLPVQGMFENFNANGLLYPVVSFSAGVKLVSTLLLFFWVVFFFMFFFSRNPQNNKFSLPLFLENKSSFSVWGKAWRVSLPATSRLCFLLWSSSPKSQTEGTAVSGIHFGSWWRETRAYWPLSACHSSYLHSDNNRYQQGKSCFTKMKCLYT